MMRAERLKVAVIGLGLWGARAHLPALAACDDVEIVALADADAELARSTAAQYGVERIFDEGAALLAGVDGLDAVVVATPTDTHHGLVMAAVQRGLHVLCEKPLAYDLDQAQEMAVALAARQRVGKLGFLFRFSPVVERMHRLVQEGYIGDVRLLESLTLNAQFADPTRPRHWKMQRSRANGGVFVEYGAHSIDLALWIGGPISSVVAHGVTLVPERPAPTGGTRLVDVDDAAAWIATYAHGGEALFRTGWASLPIGGGGLRVYGSRGSLAWDLDATTRRHERLLAATTDDPEPHVVFEFKPEFDPRTDEGVFPLGLLARYNARLVRSFVDDVRAGAGAGPGFQDGLNAQRVLAAIRRSMDERRWIDLDVPRVPEMS